MSRRSTEHTSPVREIPFQESTLEMIDEAMLRYLREELDLRTNTPKGFEKTSVLWVIPERSYQAKHDQLLRDDNGALILPIITCGRGPANKNPNFKGSVWANLPDIPDFKRGSEVTISRRINPNRSSYFINADAKRKKGKLNFPRKSKKTIYQSITTPLPTYVELNYKVMIRTEYQEQMNDLLTPFYTKPGQINYILLKGEQHRYEGFIQGDFDEGGNREELGETERLFETTIKIRVLGYLIGNTKNQETPRVVIRENAVDVKITRERAMFGEIPSHNDDKSFYTE